MMFTLAHLILVGCGAFVFGFVLAVVMAYEVWLPWAPPNADPITKRETR